VKYRERGEVLGEQDGVDGKDLRLEDKDKDLWSEDKTSSGPRGSSKTRTFIEDCQQDWVTTKNGLLTL